MIFRPSHSQWKGNVDFFRPCGVAEGAVHADTQNLASAAQFLQVRLEVLHLLGSTTGEGEDIKRQRHVFLPLEIMERDHIFKCLVPQAEVGAMSPTFNAGAGGGAGASFFSWR